MLLGLWLHYERSGLKLPEKIDESEHIQQSVIEDLANRFPLSKGLEPIQD